MKLAAAVRMARRTARVGRPAGLSRRGACLGKTGTHLHLGPLLLEPLHRSHRLGGPRRPRFQEARLRLLGWRPDVPRPRRGHRPGRLDLAQRFRPGRRRASPASRAPSRPSPGPKQRSGRTRCAAASSVPPPTGTPSSRPTARRSSSSATPGTPPAPTASAGTTTTASAPSARSAGFKDYVRYRKAQGFNWVNIIAAFPNWMTDGAPWHVVMNDPSAPPSAPPGSSSAPAAPRTWTTKAAARSSSPARSPATRTCSPTWTAINPAYFQYSTARSTT